MASTLSEIVQRHTEAVKVNIEKIDQAEKDCRIMWRDTLSPLCEGLKYEWDTAADECIATFAPGNTIQDVSTLKFKYSGEKILEVTVLFSPRAFGAFVSITATGAGKTVELEIEDNDFDAIPLNRFDRSQFMDFVKECLAVVLSTRVPD